ncbi:MAG: response regulator [Candidatus Omnitrophica bacterium]|nr:response regulator [Candidatus Omnitrophota bacterium]
MPKTILIADTSADTRSFLKKLLADRYPLIIIESPADISAIDIEKHTPSLALIGMNESQDSNGGNVFSDIRKHDAGITVIALGERNSENTAIEAVRLGATGYMIKPLDPHAIISLAGKHA